MLGAVGGSTGAATIKQTSKASGSSEVASSTVKPKKKRQGKCCQNSEFSNFQIAILEAVVKMHAF